MLAVDIPRPPPQVESPGWNWVFLHDEAELSDPDNRWYLDGSRRFPTVHALASTGCGVAVTDSTGRLIACAFATPPAWVVSASAAETWALLLTVRAVAFPPLRASDCCESWGHRCG